MNLSDNDNFNLAWQLVENTGVNVFLTGKAGTGKTTFLKYLREHSSKRMVVLAPTGIAAINANGVTIHSFFQFTPGLYVPNIDKQEHYDHFSKEKLRIIRTLDLIVIDEISMVRADLLDRIDASLRRHRNSWKPFGGIQLLIIGDLGQLPPVVKDAERALLAKDYKTPYFFSSNALKQAGYEMIELTKVYRQNDDYFVRLLNSVRDNTANKMVFSALNSRYIKNFNPDDSLGYIRLTTHNAQADTINERRLALLDTPTQIYNATITGDFLESSYPADKELRLKVGAQVMFLRNDPAGNYFNGLIGHVTRLTSSQVEVVPLNSTKTIPVEPVMWQNTRYALEEKTGKITEVVIGDFKQIPLRTAWAITIHKSQGLTFEHAIIDAANSFAHGQTYVALSRCRTLEGLVLDSPLSPSAIISDRSIAAFTHHCQAVNYDDHKLKTLTDEYYFTTLFSLFDFEDIRRHFNTLNRLVQEFLSTTYPLLSTRYNDADGALEHNIESVAFKFKNICRSIIMQSADYSNDVHLDERIKSACIYFCKHINLLSELIANTPVAVDNKVITKRLTSAITDTTDTLYIKSQLLATFALEQFTVKTFLATQSKATLTINDARKSTMRSSENKRKLRTPPDVRNKDIYTALVTWRRKMMATHNVPAFAILPNKTLIAIANAVPTTLFALTNIPGMGKTKISQFGNQILDVIKESS